MTSTGTDAFRYVGPALRELRTRKGWTQAQLAERAVSTKSQISNYENGVKAPSLGSLGCLLAALDVDLFDFAAEMKEIEAPGSAEERMRQAGALRPLLSERLEGLSNLPEAELEAAIEAVLRFLVVFIRGERGGGDGG